MYSKYVSTNTNTSSNTSSNIKPRNALYGTGTCLYDNILNTYNIPININKIKFYYIFGAGCTNDYINFTDIFNKKIYNRNFIENNIKLYCNKLHKTIINILFRIISKSDNKFIIDIQTSIIKDLQNGYFVFVLGHSYGGFIISRIAENLNNISNKDILKKLFMYTFGSIYIPKIKLSSINIIHFLNKIDISLRLTKTDYNKCFTSNTVFRCLVLPNIIGERRKVLKFTISKINEQIIFIEIINYDNNNKFNNTKKNLLKTLRKEWKSHNEYDDLIYSIINYHSIRLYLSKLYSKVEL